jgi:hypothetical protein
MVLLALALAPMDIVSRSSVPLPYMFLILHDKVYVPCTTPINMTIVVNDVTIPLHPLDLTQSNGQNSASCTGLIQDADVALKQSNIGDLVLGVPFMRSVYTVLALTPPHSNGTFDTTMPLLGANSDINPRLGLLSLTDPTIAMEEFHDVRVLGHPLSGTGTNTTLPTSHHGLSVGIKILIGIASCFAALVAIFLVRFLYQRRKWKKDNNRSSDTSLDGGKGEMELTVIEGKEIPPDKTKLADKMSGQVHPEELVRKRVNSSGNTFDSARTKVGVDGEEEMLMDEFGLVYFGKKVYHRSESSGSSGRRDTVVWDDNTRRNSARSAAPPTFDDYDTDTMPASSAFQADHQITTQPENTSSHLEFVEFPTTEDDIGNTDPPVDSMAGIGTRNARRLTNDDFSVAATSRLSSHGLLMFPSMQPTPSPENDSPLTGLDRPKSNIDGAST